MDEQKFNNFSLTLIGNLEQYNDVISKGRCRIFYKGKNRNMSFISDEFANKLLSTLPYAPVKGIYSVNEEDYTDHGTSNEQGRIYGVVPAEPNISWEEHTDEDGITRTYACADVLLYTTLYQEAAKILGSGQSMELAAGSIKGDWQIMDNERYFVFEDGCFLGLQALGENTEPCFEGAAFFSLHQLAEQYHRETNEQGGNIMDINFKMSDNQKWVAIWNLLNPEVDGVREVSYEICDIYDDYAIAYNQTDGTYSRVFYTKDDANDTVVLGNIERCFMVDVNENELSALNVLKTLNGGNYALIDESYEAQKNEIFSLNQKNVEQDNLIATLNTEREELRNANSEFAAQVSELSNKVAELTAYKLNCERNKKFSIIDSYQGKLNEDTLAEYRDNVDNYDELSLDMHLTYALKQATPSLFSLQSAVIPTINTEVDGLSAILSRYEKK